MAAAEKPAIAWDMDDTLCHLTPVLVREVHRATGKWLTDADLERGHWVQHHVPPEMVAKVEAAIFARHIYRGLTPTIALHNFVGQMGNSLRTHFNNHVVTARGQALGNVALDITHMWLSGWHMRPSGITITTPQDSKVAHAPRNTVAIVDDSHRVIQDALDAGLYGFLIDHPWNRKYWFKPSDRFHRVALDEVVSRLTSVLAWSEG